MKHNLNKMMSLDFYVSSLNEEEYKKISPLLRQTSKTAKLPLVSWGLQNEYNKNEASMIQQEEDIKQLRQLAKKFNWKNNLEAILQNNIYEALVVTTLQKEIIWLNKGFFPMTGYSQKEAINKTPAFLQGPKTLTTTKNRIHKKLQEQKPFKAVITNYKKDKTTYKCQLHIFPLRAHKVTHFLALEKQVV
ncbi:PAS domain-containing protein [Galbibacter pacificus]|uniref:PAS domain-containing protein n=1 Tax=Galbibacter pacificus TaxID=2996052 RepID=A0ABT6FNU2_9FLAO|nr:PAS domain-containing protein [Galbibacter pacificus]MDG3581458.1 PAS domain-containing protein [Galbibacter pacificus]MDG3584936.1 PAS domain-containing protein [Galbibacter pacificus]